MFREVPYTIDLIAVEPMGGAFFGGVYFSLTSRLTAEVKEDLTLYIGETSLNFKGTRDAGGFTYLWPGDQQVEDFQVTLGPGQDWSMETEVELRLRVNAPPVFTSAAGFTVDENERSVGEVRATDDDPGDTYIRYEITGGADEELFEIDDESGALSFKSAPNYEDPQDEAANNTYEVEVEARSGDDQRAHSEDFITKRTRQTITVRVTDVDEQPAKPAKPTLAADANSTTSLRVSWTKPGLNGGPEINGYNVQYRAYVEGMDGDWTDVAHDGTALTATITGLSADTDYEARVQAYNDEAKSDWSDPSEPFSPKSCALEAGDLWCGVVTVAEVQGNAAHGFSDLTLSPGGDLDGNPEDKMFPGGSIEGIYVGTTGAGSGNLNFVLDARLSPDDRATLALHVDGGSEPFAFSAASKADIIHAYIWSGSGLNWSSESSVTLRLRRKAAPMLSIADARADEGDAVAFMVTLSEAVAADVTVDWTASLETDDTAETNDFDDLSAAEGTLTFSANTSQTMATFAVATAQDDDADDRDLHGDAVEPISGVGATGERHGNGHDRRRRGGGDPADAEHRRCRGGRGRRRGVHGDADGGGLGEGDGDLDGVDRERRHGERGGPRDDEDGGGGVR